MRTLETRHIYGGSVVKRKVKCPTHRPYFTYETDDGIWRSIERIAVDRLRRIEADHRRFKRNEAIRKARAKGALVKTLAHAYGLGETAISAICKHDR